MTSTAGAVARALRVTAGGTMPSTRLSGLAGASLRLRALWQPVPLAALRPTWAPVDATTSGSRMWARVDAACAAADVQSRAGRGEPAATTDQRVRRSTASPNIGAGQSEQTMSGRRPIWSAPPASSASGVTAFAAGSSGRSLVFPRSTMPAPSLATVRRAPTGAAMPLVNLAAQVGDGGSEMIQRSAALPTHSQGTSATPTAAAQAPQVSPAPSLSWIPAPQPGDGAAKPASLSQPTLSSASAAQAHGGTGTSKGRSPAQASASWSTDVSDGPTRTANFASGSGSTNTGTPSFTTTDQPGGLAGLLSRWSSSDSTTNNAGTDVNDSAREQGHSTVDPANEPRNSASLVTNPSVVSPMVSQSPARIAAEKEIDAELLARSADFIDLVESAMAEVLRRDAASHGLSGGY